MEAQYFPIQTQSMKNIAMKVLTSMPLPCEITIQPFRTARSQAQNRLYWKWLGEISRQMEVISAEGERIKLNKDQWHTAIAEEFLGLDEFEIKGKTYRQSKSTKKLKVGEFAEYLTKIEAYFLEKGVALTFTDDYGKALGHET